LGTLLFPWYVPFARAGSEESASRIRILTVNVTWINHNYENVFRLLQQEKPDVICMQETTPQWLDALKSLYPDYPYSVSDPGIRPASGIAMLSRIPLSQTKVLGESGRPMLSAVLQIGQRRVRMLTFHLLPPINGYCVRANSEEMEELARLVKGSDLPSIVAGDLNATPWSPGCRRLEKTTGLVNTRRGWGLLATWPAYRRWFVFPIDHILASRELKAARCWRGPRVGSDHYPLFADLDMSSAPERGSS
jgi:endonuclease/exonuclease/phosphatase (EEP) superfamily protein YafD